MKTHVKVKILLHTVTAQPQPVKRELY